MRRATTRAARRLAALLAAVAPLATAGVAQARAHPPASDTAAAPAALVLPNLTGQRASPTDPALGPGVPIFNIDVSEATTAPDDPNLVGGADSSCQTTIPTQGSSTLWYRLRGPGDTDLLERTAITLDTVGSDQPTAIAVYEGEATAAGQRWCERENAARGAASVSFVTTAGASYLVEIASVGTRLRRLALQARAWDVQPPSVAVTARSVAAEPGRPSLFEVAGGQATDAGAGVRASSYGWSLSFRSDAGVERVLEPTRASLTAVAVVWPTDLGPGRGTARVRVSDEAGTTASATLTLRVRDRTAPRVVRNGYRADAVRRRVRLRSSCSEPGRAQALLVRQGRVVRASTEFARRRAPRVNRLFRRLAPGTYVVRYSCTDLARNVSDVEYGLFILPR